MCNAISESMESLTSPYEDSTRVEEIAKFFAELQLTDWEHPGFGTNLARQPESSKTSAAHTTNQVNKAGS